MAPSKRTLLPSPRPSVIAHRGATLEGHGNTLGALKRALELGADGVEVDVRSTRDQALVLHHDATIGTKRLARLDLAQARSTARGKGRELATLDEGLEAIEAPFWNLEIKERGLAEPVLDRVRRYDLEDQVLISSFNPNVIQQVADKAPEVPTGLLLDPRVALQLLYRRRRAKRLEKRAQEASADVLVAHEAFFRLRMAGSLRATQRPILAWTVNRDRRLQRLLAHPFIAGAITDRTARAIHLRRLLNKAATRVPILAPLAETISASPASR